MTRVCFNCGEIVDDEMKFCEQCGVLLNGDVVGVSKQAAKPKRAGLRCFIECSLIVILSVIIIILIFGIFGAFKKGSSTLTNEQIIQTVKNAYFDNYPNKTIGEYFDFLEKSLLISEAGNLSWVVGSDEVKKSVVSTGTVPSFNPKNEELVCCLFYVEDGDDVMIFSYYFTFNKQNKKVAFVYASILGEDAQILEYKTKDMLNTAARAIVELEANAYR